MEWKFIFKWRLLLSSYTFCFHVLSRHGAHRRAFHVWVCSPSDTSLGPSPPTRWGDTYSLAFPLIGWCSDVQIDKAVAWEEWPCDRCHRSQDPEHFPFWGTWIVASSSFVIKMLRNHPMLRTVEKHSILLLFRTECPTSTKLWNFQHLKFLYFPRDILMKVSLYFGFTGEITSFQFLIKRLVNSFLLFSVTTLL